MGPFDFLNDPVVMTIVSLVVIMVSVMLYVTRPKARKAIVWERLREGIGILSFGTITANKAQIAAGIPSLKLKDRREFPIPKELTDSYETIDVPRSMKISKGIHPFYGIEKNQVVKFNSSLAEAPEGLIAPSHLPKYASRSTLGKVLTFGGGATAWTMVILALGAGIAVGYILYPMVVHTPPVVEYCNHFANGSIGTCSPFP